jgi:hypothetical protein
VIGPATPPPILTGDQAKLLRALSDRDARHGSRLAGMFMGAVVVLRQTENMDRMAQSAQSMRELLEKLPQSYDGAPVRVPGAKASDHLQRIRVEYKRVKGSLCYDADGRTWAGTIDTLLERFLISIDEIIVPVQGQINRREATRLFSRDVDPSPVPLSEAQENAFLGRWMECDDFFQAVAHHGRYPDFREFQENLDACTVMLLEKLAPSVAEDFRRLEQLIDEAE